MAARSALRSFAFLRRLVLVGVGVIVVLLVLRTPTAPYFSPGRTQLPPTPPTAADGDKYPRRRLPVEFQNFLSWDPPDEGHFPPYDGYKERDFDPNRWEGFAQNSGLYLNGTLKRLSKEEAELQSYSPYPDYTSDEYRQEYRGSYHECDGPSGKPITQDEMGLTKAYQGVPDGFPYPDIGSWEALGLDESVCFDRLGRLGPYGLQDPKDKSSKPIDFSKVKWGQLQDACLRKNADRFDDSTVPDRRPGISKAHRERRDVQDLPAKSDTASSLKQEETRAHQHKATTKTHKPRSAVLIRTWDTYEYQENDIMAIRALVSELSLQSGGEYHVFLFVNIKENDIPVFKDEQIYQETLDQYVPAELHDIAILWTEQVCQEWYPKIGEWNVYWEQFMPLQWFSRTHPEFDYVWNWEMDARLIGQHYHFLESASAFAKKQPRKFLWERNARFYIPKLHGDWEKYFQESNFLIETAKHHTPTVWGPQPWSPEQSVRGPTPPTDEIDDSFSWGVGEEADLITMLPMWDPRETWWSYRDHVFNYPGSDKATQERPFPHIPRRVFINTLVRLSKDLLDAMHYENQAGLSMASELWPGSVALQHGYKGVYAPHPIWQSHVWDPQYMELVFNADGWGAGSLPGTDIDDGRGVGYNKDLDIRQQPQEGTGPNKEGRVGRWSQERDSPYNPDREHNFGGWTWYFWSDLPRVIYWRWMGWSSGLTLGTESLRDELGWVGDGSVSNCEDHFWIVDPVRLTAEQWERSHGRLCLPHMLLHPVKNVRPYE
ncbi:MAG: hypothetical protein Q9162_000390 [Coniocarpon cinnabarinum]